MSKNNKKFGLMIYPGSPKYNVGDYIQSLAAKQFLPHVDQLIEREKLNDYNNEDVKMIMNGWYIHNPKQFRPSDKIKPLYISFHLNSSYKDEVLGNQKNIDFLNLHSPIGCRDIHTLENLKEFGVDAYYSGCLTTTLDLKYKSNKKREKIYFADPLWTLPHLDRFFYSKYSFFKGIKNGDFLKFNKRKALLKRLFSEDILNSAEVIKHKLSGRHDENRRFQEAEDVLNKLASAKLVITSRIHAALPCLALGTPVIFINYGLDTSSEKSRLNGLVELFNTINISNAGEITANFELPDKGRISIQDIKENPDKYVEYAEKMKSKCQIFIDDFKL